PPSGHRPLPSTASHGPQTMVALPFRSVSSSETARITLMTEIDVRRHLEIAKIAAREAGDFIRAAWDQDTGFELKADQSLLTEIDLGSETLLRQILTRHAPHTEILGEEQGASGAHLDEGLWWYVDPVDG